MFESDEEKANIHQTLRAAGGKGYRGHYSQVQSRIFHLSVSFYSSPEWTNERQPSPGLS